MNQEDCSFELLVAISNLFPAGGSIMNLSFLAAGRARKKH